MGNLIILVGVPGSGKSTFAAEYAATNANAVIVGRDKLRELLFGFTEATVIDYYKHPEFKQREETVTSIQRAIILLSLQNKATVLVDDTNCRWDRLCSLMDHFKAFTTTVKFFDTPLDECLRRNELRNRKVPTEAVLSFYESFLTCKTEWEASHKPKLLTEEGFVFLDAAKRPFWIALWEGEPWMFYWHPDKRWVSLRRVNQTDIWMASESRLPEDQANHYHVLSKRELV